MNIRIDQAIERYGFSRRTIYYWMKTGTVQFKMVGRTRLVDEDDMKAQRAHKPFTLKEKRAIH